MQKINMPAKFWCDHADGFESGLRAWELDVGDWERASGTALADAVKYTVMMNMAPISLRNSLQLGTYPNSAARRAAFSSRNFGANPTVTAGNVLSADVDRMQVDSPKKGQEKVKSKLHHQRGIRPTSTANTSSADINTCKNCGRTGHWENDCWRPDGGAYDTATSNNNNNNPQKGKGHGPKKGKGKGKHVDVVETNQPSDTASTVSFFSQTTEYNWRTLVHFKRGTADHGCDTQFRVNRKTSWCRQWCTAPRLSNHVYRTKDTIALSWNPHCKWSKTPT